MYRYVDYVLGGSRPTYGRGGAITQWYTNANVIKVGFVSARLDQSEHCHKMAIAWLLLVNLAKGSRRLYQLV